MSFPSCPRCGVAALFPHAQFCGHCGASLAADPANVPRWQRPAPPRYSHVVMARIALSCPECGAPMTKTGWVTLRALTMRMWRGGINRVLEAGPAEAAGQGKAVGRGAQSGAVHRSGLPVPYSVRRPHKLSPCEYYRLS